MSRADDARIVRRALTRSARRRSEAAAENRRSASRASVVRVSPIVLDLHGSDLTLDADDVELGQDVARYHASEGLKKGDVLVVTEVADGDWIATTVVSSTTVRAVPE